MELLLIYLWLKLDSFGALLTGVIIAGTLFYFLGWIPRVIEQLDREDDGLGLVFCRWHSRMVWAVCGAVMLQLVTPSSKDVAILVGSSIALDVAKSPEGTKVASLLRGKANELLDEEISKLTTKKGN